MIEVARERDIEKEREMREVERREIQTKKKGSRVPVPSYPEYSGDIVLLAALPTSELFPISAMLPGLCLIKRAFNRTASLPY